MVNTISVRDLTRMRFGRSRRLLDLRDPEDYEKGYFPGAENFPFDTMESWAGTLPVDAEYVMICEHGSAALRAAGELTRLGYRATAVVGGYSYLDREKPVRR